jgi:hypothetical protein
MLVDSRPGREHDSGPNERVEAVKLSIEEILDPRTKIGSVRFTDGTQRDVFEDAEGKQLVEDDGELVAGQWLPPSDGALDKEVWIGPSDSEARR